MTITYPPNAADIDYSPFPGARIPAETRARGNRAAVAPDKAARPSVLRRVLTALVEARMREAEREIARHRHLVPAELEAAGDRITARSEDTLPFSR